MTDESTPYEKQMRKAMDALKAIADAPAPEGLAPVDHAGARMSAISRVEDFASDLYYEIYNANPGMSGAIPGCECGCGGDYLFTEGTGHE